MEIVEEWPPNKEKIEKVFPREVLDERKPVFSYGGRIYNPYKTKITPDLHVHEAAHFHQQKNDVEKWWDTYLSDEQFRLEQETEAYVTQYKFIKQSLPNKAVKWYLDKFAESLSGPLYGNLLTQEQAHTKIRKSSTIEHAKPNNVQN